MSDRSSLKKFFQLFAKESNAYRLFLPALAILVLYKPVGWWIFPPMDPEFRIELRKDSLLNTSQIIHVEKHFDPNAMTPDEWKSFGLDSGLIRRINRYREKGGRFREKEDLLALYGMDTALYRQLEPWVRFSQNDSVRSRRFVRSPRPQPKTFDLNLADTADFEAVTGVGRKTAVRIMKYRAALGGFIGKHQLYEIWMIDSLAVFSLSDFFVAKGFQPVKLDLNLASEAQLDFHPYLNRIQARAILFYRFQHGVFKSVEELTRVRLLDSVTVRKLRHYVTTGSN